MVDQYVFWFEVSVNYVFRMQVLKHTNDLRRVKLSLFRFKLPHSSKICEHFSSSDKLNNKVEVSIVLCKAFHCDYKWMINGSQYIVFIHDVIYLFHLYDLCLFHNFHCNILFSLPSPFVFCDSHSAKRSRSKSYSQIKIF